MGFTAKFSGTCADCGERFEAGTEIRYDEGEIVHADPSECSISTAAGSRTGRPCPSCFLVHAGECF